MSSLTRLAATSPGEVSPAPPAEVPPAPLRGRRYGEDHLHLLVRDPRRLFAAWEISPELAARASQMAAAVRAPLRYQLRIERGAPEGETHGHMATADLPDAVLGEAWYFDLSESGVIVRALLGIDLPDGFVSLLTSRWASVPPEGKCAEEGAWAIDSEASAWLKRQAALSRPSEFRSSSSTGSRFLAPPTRPAP